MNPRRRSARVKFLYLTFALAILVLGVSIAPVSAAAGKFLRGFSDPIYQEGSALQRQQWLQRSAEVGTDVIRIDVVWSRVARSQPANPSDPGDPAYDFAKVDEAVRGAAAHGFRILLTFQYAPSWAEGSNRDPRAAAGTWKPEPDALGQFAEAVAGRYSGSYSPGLAQPALPAVSYIEPWNEPNLPNFLNPQWKGKKATKPASPGNYREMLNAAYEGAHRANAQVNVVGGSTAPYGDDPGEGARIRPLRFFRKLLCLHVKRGKLKGDRCKVKAKMDLLSHHPITTSGGPRRSAISPDDVAISDFKNLVEVLRAAERAKTIRPKGRRQAWATEIWWETDPPDKAEWAFPVDKVARWVPEALHLLRKQGASAAIWLQIVDTPVSPDGFSAYQTGLYYADGSPKPLADAWRSAFSGNRTQPRAAGDQRAGPSPPMARTKHPHPHAPPYLAPYLESP